MEIKNTKNEKGSLSLEHILFIGAVVLLSAGITTFYTNINTFFSSVSFTDTPNIGVSGASTSN